MTHTVFLFLPTVMLFREQLRCVGFFRQFTDCACTCQRDCKRERKNGQIRKGNRVWGLGRAVSKDSVWAAVYSGMTAKNTVDREGDGGDERGKVNEYYKQ